MTKFILFDRINRFGFFTKNPVSGPKDSSTEGHLPYLQGWRGLAVLLVMIGHFVSIAPGKIAGTGVELFFVLSGRLMAEMLIIKRQTLPDFLFRRTSRLLPALLFYALAMLFVIAVNSTFGSFRHGLIGAVAAVGFFQNYLPLDKVASLFEHCWSLAVEAHCYALLALIAVLAGRGRRAAAAIAALVAVAAIANGWRLSQAEIEGGQYVYWRTDARAASILLPFAIYLWVHDRGWKTPGRLRTWASPAGLAIGLALTIHPAVPDPLRFSLGTAFLALGVATLDAAPAGLRRLFELRVLIWLGLISYSLYLWQQPFFMLSKGGTPALLGVALALAGGVLSFRNVERPARRALNDWWRSRRPGAAAAAPSPAG